MKPAGASRWDGPALVAVAAVCLAWALAMQARDGWSLVADHWHMSLAMTLGSFIADATSESGGAVALPQRRRP